MDSSCLVSTVVWWWCNGVGDIFLAHFGPLVPIEHCLNAAAYRSIVADHVRPFMTTVYPSSDGYFQQDNAPCHNGQPTNSQQLRDAIMSIWTKISEEFF